MATAEAGRRELSAVPVAVDDAPLPAEASAASHIGTEISLSLLACSQTLPVLVRVQFIRFPTMRWQCLHCRGETVPQAACPACGAEEAKCVFYVVLELSDGVDFVEAVAHGAVCESLFELSESVYAARFHADPSFEKTICTSLIGTPVLVWLLSLESGYSIVQCKHVNLSSFASTLLGVLENM
ncbi:hypothetical protein STCU_12194 [Strigomonas culicis]|uniref:Uncharacterized protein n=1 Tax=Strigomonas culicis TaxID=28005 RepID=S9UXJ0_9TRYP|nr:hypothetical protein STCU_12194 [Strigomonas culicis]|eukprot:EPY15255.1 hypothetical protein STCU_12194 [Strigomonas culicis]